MGNDAQPTEVKVGYLQLSENERKQVVMDQEAVKSVLVSGFRDDLDAEIKAAREAWEKETDPTTRPGFSTPVDPKADTIEIDIKRFGAVKRAVVSKATGQTVGWIDAATAQSARLAPDQALGETKGGFMPPQQMSPDERGTVAKEFVAFVDDLAKKDAAFAVLKYPRGDIDNFSACRWAMATERANNTAEGSAAYAKHAPWESAYYSALERYAATKAQGDMVSGQDGGFLAPEMWATNLIDQIYPASATSRLGLTRIPMGTRVVHVPRLSAAISVAYSAENASLTASSAQFQQVSFTARKQYAFVQISNELIRDSNPAAESILRNNATRYMAIDQDYQILLGTGLAGAPTGLFNQTNVTKGTGTSSGNFAATGAPAFDDILTAIYNVENLNASTNVPIGQAMCSGIVGPVKLKLGVTKMKDASTSRPEFDFGLNQMRWANRQDGSSALDGLFGVDTWVLSNIVVNTLNSSAAQTGAAGTGTQSPVFFGDWQHLWVMERQDIEILASNVAGTAFAADQTWIRLIRRYDVGVAHPEPFFITTNG